ncbi:MAG: L,D-transpeptidase family protein [Pseudomonadota bacterium]
MTKLCCARASVLHFCTALVFAAVLNLVAAVSVSASVNEALAKELSALTRSDPQIVEFYQANGLQPLWVGSKNRTRRAGLIRALKASGAHGVPNGTYGIADLENALKASDAARMAKAEILASQIFVKFGRDLNSGVVKPSSVDREIAIAPAVLSASALLDYAESSNPKRYIDGLAPQTANYEALLKERDRLLRVIARGGYGLQVPGSKIEKGESGSHVQILRARLTAMEYRAGNSPNFDDALEKVVKQFQADHGMNADGVVGKGTLAVLNLSAEDRLARVVANLERERWFTRNRGKRHIWVNIADARVTVYDNGRATFTSRTVVGKAVRDQRTPEFADEMTYMVINPTWHVPRSIAGKEYLPILQSDPGFLARRNMRLLTQSGETVSASGVNFSQYSESNFPYLIKQRPDPGNALGRVKFMFPNRYNIYLHDTPAKSLFNRDYRAHSHGCIRVQEPFEFAYHLLAKQTGNAKGFFHTILDRGAEQYVNLKEPVPVYISYNTAFLGKTGDITYRHDVYGRDAKVYNALLKAGVRLQSQGS